MQLKTALERFPIARSAGLSAPRTRPSKGPRYTETETAPAANSAVDRSARVGGTVYATEGDEVELRICPANASGA
jgi:hypothetical protein